MVCFLKQDKQPYIIMKKKKIIENMEILVDSQNCIFLFFDSLTFLIQGVPEKMVQEVSPYL